MRWLVRTSFISRICNVSTARWAASASCKALSSSRRKSSMSAIFFSYFCSGGGTVVWLVFARLPQLPLTSVSSLSLASKARFSSRIAWSARSGLLAFAPILQSTWKTERGWCGPGQVGFAGWFHVFIFV